MGDLAEKRDALLNTFSKRKIVKFSDPQLPFDIELRQWNGSDRDRWNGEVLRRADKDGNVVNFDSLKAIAVCMSMYDSENEKYLFRVDEAEQINSILPGDLLNEMFKVVEKMNHIGAEEVEVAEKN